MSRFYDDDEKDHYQGDAWGGKSMKSIYESSVREKFTLPDEEDAQEVSPSFGGSFQLKHKTAFGGAPSGTPSGALGGASSGAQRPTRVSIRSIFGGNHEESSTSDSDISLAELLGSDSDSEVSENDVKEVKEKFGGSNLNNVPEKKLNNYREMKKNWGNRKEEDHPRDARGGDLHGGDLHGGRHRDKRTGRYQAGEASHGGRRDEITDSDEEEVHRDVPRVYGIYGKPSVPSTSPLGGGYDSDSDSEGLEKLF